MVTNNFVVCALMLSIFVLSAEGAAIHGDNISKHNQILYRRYIRRRPPMHRYDQYFDEVVEIFHTKQKPPSIVNIMTDEDVDKFIFCDFNRELEECKIYWESRISKKPTITTTQKPKVKLTTNIPMKATTKTPVVVETTTAKATTNEIITSSDSEFVSDLPRLPDIIEEYDYDDQNTLKQDVETVYEDTSNENDDINEDADEDKNEYETENNSVEDKIEDENEDANENEDQTENDYENNDIFL